MARTKGQKKSGKEDSERQGYDGNLQRLASEALTEKDTEQR